jgi:hypothetical protein
MLNSVPYEVIAAPYTLYVAPVGTAFPEVDTDPGAAWIKVGTSGPLNYDDAAGVTIEHRQTVVSWRSAGDTGTRKRFRTEEDLAVRMKLVDVTLEQYAHALNYNAVTDVPAGVGTPGYRKIGLSRGTQIVTKALLVRADISPYGEDLKSQYEIPLAQQSGSPTVSLSKKGEPEGLDLEWMALVDTTAASDAERFGRLVAQDADANS